MEKSLYERIALSLMERYLNGKEYKTIPDREKILEVVDKMRKDPSYYQVHNNALNPDQLLISKFKNNEKILFDNLLNNLDKYIQFDVEMQKYGKICGCCCGNRKRWALINYPDGIYSLGDPLILKGKKEAPPFEEVKKKAKDKTDWLKKSKIKYEEKSRESIDWIINDKNYRIVLAPNPENGKKTMPIYFYFASPDIREKVGRLLKLLKCKLTMDEQTNFTVRKMLNMVETSNMYYSTIKILNLKNELVARKAVLNSTKNYANSQFTQFRYIGEKIHSNFHDYYRKMRKLIGQRVTYRDGGSKSTIVSFKSSNYSRKPLTINDLKTAVLSIQKLNKFNFDLGIRWPLKCVSFKLASCSYKELENSQYVPKDAKSNLTFTIDKKEIEINFSDKRKLQWTDILNISNVFINSSDDFKLEPNSLVINGPNMNSSGFIRYYLNKNYYENNLHERFVEPDSFGLSYVQANPPKIEGLTIQVLFCTFHFDRKNIDELASKFNISNSSLKPEDYYYYLNVTVNKTFSTRSSLIKLHKYVNDTVYLEFNKQFVFNAATLSNNFQEAEIVISVHMIPQFSVTYSDYNINNYVDYLVNERIGYCLLNFDKFEHDLLSERLRINEANKIIINTGKSEIKSNLTTRLFGRELNVGCDFYVLEEIDYNYIQAMRSNELIDERTKDIFWNIRFDDDKNILLRLPNNKEYKKLGKGYNEETLITELLDNRYVNRQDLKRILENRHYRFLPHVQILKQNKDMESENGNIDYDDALEMGYKNGNWITRLKKFRKYFPAKFLGITESSNVYYKNYITGEIKCVKINVQNFKEYSKILRTVQENLFCIYNFEDIEPNLIENIPNYKWSMKMSFPCKEMMDNFLYFLKDLRRRAYLKLKNELTSREQNIDVDVLLAAARDSRNKMKNLKLHMNKLEIRHHFTLPENASMTIKFSKGESENNARERFIIEYLEENMYRNNLLDINEVDFELQYIKNSNVEMRTLIEDLPINAEMFNRLKLLKFESENTNSSNLVEFEVKPKIDQFCIVEVSFRTSKDTIVLIGEIDVAKLVDNNNYCADIYFVPLKLKESIITLTNKTLDSDTVVAIVNANIFTTKRGENTSFNEVFEKYLFDLKYIRDDYNNYVSFGKYEPNVYKRLIIEKIQNEFNVPLKSIDANFLSDEMNKTKLVHILEKNCIRGAMELNSNIKSEEWKDLVVDLDFYNYRVQKKFYINKKRNEFYRKFSISEFKQYLKRIRSDEKLERTVLNNPNDFYSQFPGRKNLLNYKRNFRDNFGQIRSLIYLGIPDEGRLRVWEKLMDIEQIINITIERLKTKTESNETKLYFDEVLKKPLEKRKIEIFEYIQEQLKEKFSSQFSLIDNDLNFLKIFTEYKNYSEEFKIFNTLKTIAKCFFIWSDLNIYTDNITLFDSDKKKFVYFLGLLQIIQRLDSVFQDDYKTFWLICGLSQYIEMFYQINPLFQNQMSFSKIYVFVTKLILECNLPNIYNKFVELNFPIEFFLSQNLSTIYADYFQTDLFLRIMDIIIFESALETDNNDKFDYLRLLCTIPLTLLKFNEKKIVAAKTVTELETLFKNLIVKSYNVEKFIQNLRFNIDNFYKIHSIIDRYLDFRSTATSWDHKRDKITKLVQQFFSKVEEENKLYLAKLDPSKIYAADLISNIENQIVQSLNSMRNLYSTNTDSSDNQYTVIYVVTGVYEMNLRKNDTQKFEIHYSFNKDKVNNSEHFRYADPSLRFDCNKGVVKNPKFFEISNNSLKKYLNVFLFTEKKELKGIYHLDIIKLDFMKPYKIRLESHFPNPKQGKSFIDIGIFKVYHNKLNKKDVDLYSLIFAKPNYLFDSYLYQTITGLAINDFDMNSINLLVNQDQEKFVDESDVDEFLKKEFKLNYKRSAYNIQYYSEFDRLKDLLKFYDVDTLISWVKSGTSSFQEILLSLTLIDESSLTIYEKLKLIFDITKLRNHLLYNSETISVGELKETIYSLYKRLMIYFTKVEVDRMVDFIVQRDNLFHLRYVVTYNYDNEKEVLEYLKDNNYSSGKINKYMDLLMDHTIEFSKKTCFLENVHHLKRLPDTFINYFYKMNKIFNKDHNQLIIQYGNENIRITRVYDINNGVVSPYPQPSFVDSTTVYKNSLKNEIENIELKNDDNLQIDFEKFKEIFFKLPFISDNFRCIMSFSKFSSQALIKYLPTLKVFISSVDTRHTKVFIFSDDFSNYKSSNSTIYYHIKNVIIDTGKSMQDIIEFIFKHLSEFPQEALKEIQFYLDNPKHINFQVRTDSSKLPDLIKFTDPLYSLHSIRDKKDNKSVDITFSVEGVMDISRINEQEVVFKKNGYAKYTNYDNVYTEWRECRIKDLNSRDDSRKIVAFNCFKNKAEFELKVKDTIYENQI